MKTYKINPPVGSNIITKPFLTEEELREYCLKIIQDPDEAKVWKEKIEKDPIEHVVEWLKVIGYQVEIHEQ